VVRLLVDDVRRLLRMETSTWKPLLTFCGTRWTMRIGQEQTDTLA